MVYFLYIWILFYCLPPLKERKHADPNGIETDVSHAILQLQLKKKEYLYL